MTSAIIVAAGSSRRMGFDKLAAELAGQPVLAYSLQAFEGCDEIDEIVVVTSAEKLDEIRDLARNLGISKLKNVIEGGAERHLSVWKGIEAVAPSVDLIAVHDGARPLVSSGTIRRCVDAARKSGAVALAHRITETLKRADAGTNRVTGPVSRENLWAMETPQVFAAVLLRKAYESILNTGESVTDEVSALERLNEPVELVENPEPNPKITVPGDIALAEALLAARKAKPA